MMTARRRVLALLLVPAALAACGTTRNYHDPAGPRFAGAPGGRTWPARDTLHLVSFNVKYARRVDEAIELLRAEPGLSGADILCLQEMDEAGAREIAAALGMFWVYYPATVSPVSGRDFGNAVLSRWPIVEDAKLVLPYRGRIRGTRRAVVGATIAVGDWRLRVYSVHLATPIGNGPNKRRDQLRVVLADAERYPAVVMAGDFNSETVPAIALERGYLWPTRRLPPTNTFWTFDHVLVRGLAPAGNAAVGVRGARGTSDHKPVWAVLVRGGPPAPATSSP